MAEHPYLPGKALVLSRLPAQDFFSVEEAARHSGWSPSFIRARCNSGDLAAQSFQKTGAGSTRADGKHVTYRIHVDDLVLWILTNGQEKYREEKPFRDVVSIIRTWPLWMVRELQKVLKRLFPDADAVGTRSEQGGEQ